MTSGFPFKLTVLVVAIVILFILAVSIEAGVEDRRRLSVSEPYGHVVLKGVRYVYEPGPYEWRPGYWEWHYCHYVWIPGQYERSRGRFIPEAEAGGNLKTGESTR